MKTDTQVVCIVLKSFSLGNNNIIGCDGTACLQPTPFGLRHSFSRKNEYRPTDTMKIIGESCWCIFSCVECLREEWRWHQHELVCHRGIRGKVRWLSRKYSELQQIKQILLTTLVWLCYMVMIILCKPGVS